MSFEIEKGETVGIIGRNGSGKSTLLQIICGTLTPTSGTVQTTGRIAALLELGSGFNPEFTGRENIYMNAAVLGLSKKEMDGCFDDIAAFADIGQFIEQPVKTYSSGMVVRLAFSVNIMIEPEIMIVDEALVVGDMNFQAKCMTALTRIQERGATILFVSHDIGAVKSLCSRGVYLEHGTVKAIGKAPDVAELYIRTMREEVNTEQRRSLRIETERDVNKLASKDEHQYPVENEFKTSEDFSARVAQFRYGTGGIRISYVELLDEHNRPTSYFVFNQKATIRIFVEAEISKSVSVNIQILDDKKINITGSGFLQAGRSLLATSPGEKYLIEYKLPLPLHDGDYSLKVHVSEPIIPDETAEFVDVISDAAVFKIARRGDARVWSKVYLFPELQIKRLGVG